MRMSGRRQERGLTLVELVVAIFVLSLGSVAALGVVDQSRRGLGEDAARVLAQSVALNRAEELRLYDAGAARGLPAQVTQGGLSFAVEVQRRPTAGGLTQATITVRSEAGPGAVFVTYLPGRAP